MGDKWYYYKDEKKGPLSEKDLEALILQSIISDETLIWKKGMPKWDTYKSIFGEKKPIIDHSYMNTTSSVDSHIFEVKRLIQEGSDDRTSMVPAQELKAAHKKATRSSKRMLLVAFVACAFVCVIFLIPHESPKNISLLNEKGKFIVSHPITNIAFSFHGKAGAIRSVYDQNIPVICQRISDTVCELQTDPVPEGFYTLIAVSDSQTVSQDLMIGLNEDDLRRELEETKTEIKKRSKEFQIQTILRLWSSIKKGTSLFLPEVHPDLLEIATLISDKKNHSIIEAKIRKIALDLSIELPL